MVIVHLKETGLQQKAFDKCHSDIFLVVPSGCKHVPSANNEWSIPVCDARLRDLPRVQRYHVRVFERWLKADSPVEMVKIELIQPAVLDRYLARFFTSIKTQTGEDFTKTSLFRLRSSLKRFLDDHGYPVSITTAPEFNESQQAFKQKIKQLSSLGNNRYLQDPELAHHFDA